MHKPTKLLATWAEDVATILAHDLPWAKLSACRILVSGASGFLGNYLVRTLLGLHQAGKVERPPQVLALVRDRQRAQHMFNDLATQNALEVLEWDLNQIAVPQLGPCQYVFHAASLASPRHYQSNPIGTLLPNAVGTAALLQAWYQQSHDRRGFMFVSSSEVYGSVADQHAISEDHFGTLNPAHVRACYAESKRLGETLCVAWHTQHGCPTYIVRPFHTYGPGLSENDGRVFADFAFNVVNNQDIRMSSAGLARRAFCYVSDAVAGFFTVLLRGRAATPYNVANPGAELSVHDLATLLVGLYPEKNLKVVRAQQAPDQAYLPSSVQRLLPDIQLLSALGWQAQVPAQVGFRRMIEAHLP